MIRLPLYPQPPQPAVASQKPLQRDEECTRCPHHEQASTVCMAASGDPGGLLVIMDAPGRIEDQVGLGYRGAAGRFVVESIRKTWTGPIALDYAVRCAPRTQIKDKHVEACRPYLAEVFFNAVRPTRVLTIGSAAAEGFLGHRPMLNKTRRGYAFAFDTLDDPVPVFMLSNPAHAMRNRFMKRDWVEDLQWALEADVEPDYEAVTHLVRSPADARWMHQLVALKGSGLGIRAAIRLLLGIEVQVHVYGVGLAVLGETIIGDTFILGSDDEDDLYTFWVIVQETLDAETRSYMDRIINIMKVAHERHLIVEPSEVFVPDHWALGFSQLGVETELHA